MISDKNNVNAIDSRLEWVAPSVTTLDLIETAANPGRGGQPSRYADCTRS